MFKIFIKQRKIQKNCNGIRRYYVEYIDGEITDDTKMMLATAKGIIESPEEPINSIGKTGGIAGVYYGYDNISKNWTEDLSVKDELFMVSEKISTEELI